MLSTRRRLVLTRLAVPLLAVWTGCADSPATTEDATDTGTDTDVGTTADVPTTADDTGPVTQQSVRYFLRVDDTPPPPVVLEMDKQKSLEVFGEKAARDIKLLDVDSKPLLKDILDRILYACGDKWDDYDPGIPNNLLPVDPKHDCSLTELGQSFGDTEAERKLSPQYQMVRLLTMTPRNAHVGGTVMNDMELLFSSNENNFGEFSFQDVLAASLFCPSKQGESADLCTDKLKSTHPQEAEQEALLHVRPFIATDVLADTLRLTLMASHPNIANTDGLLPVTLYDALKDMQPLAEKFGPQGEHPGLLMPDDDNFTTHSDALTAAFKLVATAESNLRRVEGIDASLGAGEMFVNISEYPLTFDFLDEQKVRFEGITEVPTVDMRMRIMELDGKAEPGQLAPVPSCDGTHGDDSEACKTNLPEMPLGDQYIWSQPVWSLEYIIGSAAYTSFKTRTYTRCFVKFGPNQCLTSANIGVPPDPAGWTVFNSQVQGPTFPPAQYFWEMLLDVGQESLHDFFGPNQTKIADGTPEIAEGALNPIFALKALPIGLTADQLIVQIRKSLQSQAGVVANTILGRYWKNNSRLDFYYRRGNEVEAGGGAPILFFVAESDLRPSKDDPEAPSAYGYANPGFFADRGLTQKLSNTDLSASSDTEHEKLQLATGTTTLFMQDDDGVTYELNFLVPASKDPTEIVVRVDPV